jgi:hypothetical protein
MRITRFVAVYRTRPVMIVVEMEEGVLLELSLQELAGSGAPAARGGGRWSIALRCP